MPSHGLLLAVGSQVAELYAASGDLVVQHPNPRPTSALGAVSVGPSLTTIALVGSDGTSIACVDGTVSGRSLATAELPTAPVALVGASDVACPVFVALLSDGSLAVLRLSSDCSSAAVATTSAADVWGAGASGFDARSSTATRLSVATTGADGSMIVAAASRSQIAILRVDPASANPSRVVTALSVWSGTVDVAAVAVAARGGSPVVYSLDRRGAVTAQHANATTGAKQGDALACPVFPDGVAGDVDSFVGSDRGVIASVTNG
eukprot:CAMPEP_0174843702 /NCGR_PEP_ID=MMETSP1114-20130205/10692_1 /TAXON_ID=312471 /ORGANISM="Neobodo designis, Strain CCAP 1951/1" /LENGTH=262 /DNA_ID=CAMNT_0016077929 /DNA_START=75 /DNA_END=859 /DNA_ORIENTATION=-